MENNQGKIKSGRGGPRPNSGRPKGAPNKATAQREAEVKASGLTPLDYMLGILRDEAAEEEKRFEAAKAAAPYVHPKLATTTLTGDLNVNMYERLAKRGDA